MLLQNQTVKHDPENGLYGDCYRACVACLLNLEVDQVPHFYHDGCNSEIGDKRCREWLKSLGMNNISMYIPETWVEHCDSWFDDVPYILTGKSPNHENVDHCVIGRGKCEVMWDVSPHKNGLNGPSVDSQGNKGYWVEFILGMGVRA